MAGFPGLGFAAGGLASSFSNTFQRGMEQNSIDNYRTQELKLQQQAQENAQKREQFARIDRSRSELMDVLTETVKQHKIANPNVTPEEIARLIQPLKEPLMRLDRSSGRDPAATDAAIIGIIARPSEAVTGEAMARARVDPLRAATPQVMGEDQFGTPVYGTYNRQTGQMQPVQQPAPSRQDSFASGEGASAADKGEAFLARLPEGLRAQVQGLANYEVAPNTFSSRIAKGATQTQRQRMIGLAEEYAAAKGETYDQKEFTGRNAAVVQFSKGQEARAVRSYNVIVPHLDQLKEASIALKNGEIQLANSLANRWAAQMGHPEVTNFEGVRNVVMDELTKAIVGGATAFGDRDEAKKTLDSKNSLSQLLGQVEEYKNLAAAQLGGLRKQYESTTGRKDFDRFLDEDTKKYFTEANRRKAERGNLTGATPEPLGGTIGPVQWEYVKK
jgi:hypothetical protein